MFRPTTNLMGGITNAFPDKLFPWDDYFMRMAETDFLCGRASAPAAKSFFIRKAPFGGSYAVLGGITHALSDINNLNFGGEDFKEGALAMGYNKNFINWLSEEATLKLRIYSMPEGSVFFPNEPVVSFEGPLAFTRLAEGILIENLNFATLSMTKWHRLVHLVRPGKVMEFGRRRAQNAEKATLYGMLAGCYATSHAEMKRFFDFNVVGTMGHEWMQSFGDVRTAFKAWLEHQPGKPVGLVDTKQCMEHDFPIWLDEVYKHCEQIKNSNPPLWGWRNDSGNLIKLSIDQWIRFLKHPLAQDPWFREKATIFLTNEIDEYAAQSMIHEASEITSSNRIPKTPEVRSHHDYVTLQEILERIVWASGTKQATCYDQPALGGVAKLVECNTFSCIKLAFDAEGQTGIKTSIPGLNGSSWIEDKFGQLKCVAIYPIRSYDETNEKFWAKGEELTVIHPNNPAHRLSFDSNFRLGAMRQKIVYDSWLGKEMGINQLNLGQETIQSVPERIQREVNRLDWSMVKLDKPDLMKVMLTPELYELRSKMIQQGVLREDFLRKKE